MTRWLSNKQPFCVLESVLTHRKSNSVSENDLSRVGADTDSVIKLPSKTRVRQGKTIYLFNRSHREKERWFHYLREACAQHRTGAFKLASRVTVDAAVDNIARRQSAQSLPEASFIRDGGKAGVNSEYFLYVSNAVQFSRYMAAALGTTPEIECPPPLSGIVNMDLLSSKETKYLANVNSDVVLAANALASRIFYDFCRDEFWVCKVRDKVQSKLSTIALPYFIETLELSKFELGAIAPTITGIHPPVLDEWGLWTDVEISYPGGLRLVLETKVNLMKLKSEGADEGPKRKASRNSGHSAHSHHYSDLDLPISPESSPDEDMDVDETDNGGKGKLLTFVDKLANSSIFQGATDLKPVKKVLKGISSTRLILNVEVTGLEGTMAINFAPPPSDRFWYGFRHPPKLSLKAVPQVGDRAVEFTKVSDWIEKRLAILLEKNLVLPAMDDIIIPVMSGNEMLNMGYNH
uniref:SMP-LTD domain-containing protein n=1 Tax=Plectus sambesii TaxID=2011161 RepID=A0A914XKV4_9BILA